MDQPAADAYAEQVKTANPGGNCDEWYWAAMEAGFSPDQWDTVDQIMTGESGCRPSAYNPSGASGLMQVMPMWADDCGTTRDGLFDPYINLRCAKHVLDVSSWHAWEAWDGTQ